MAFDTDTDMPVAPRRPLDGVPLAPRQKTPSGSILPLPNDEEEPPGETIAVLEQARAALLKVIGSLFDAAVAIVGALLSLVQSLAGREAAEVVDKTAAEVLDTVIPDLPTDTAPTTDPPTDKTPTTDPPTSETPTGTVPVDPATPDRAAVEASVRDILVTNATEAEQGKITDQLVDLVTSGVLFMTSLEAQHPGLIERVMERETTPEGPPPSDGTTSVERDPADTPRVSVSVSVN